MLKYIARRLALLFFILFGVSLITFLVMHVIPGDHAQLVAIYRYGFDDYSAQELSSVRKDIGSGLPLYQQYLWWLGHVMHGDLGYSFITRHVLMAVTKEDFLCGLVLGSSLAGSGALGPCVAVYPPSRFLYGFRPSP